MKKLALILLAAMLVSSATVLSGCKNDDRDNKSQSITESKVTNNSAADTAQIDKLSKEIEALKSQPTFSDTKSIDAHKIAKNKRVGIVLDSSSNDFSSYIALEIKTVTSKIGFDETVVYETDGTSNSHISAIENAINDQCSALLLIGDVNKDEIAISIETAQANGIKVISLNNSNIGEKEHYVDSAITIDYNKEAKALADSAIVENNAQVNALLVIPSGLKYAESMKNTVNEELKKYSSGYCTELNADTSTWGKGLSDQIKKSLEKDTNINSVIVLHEGMLKDTVDALEMSQAMTRVKLFSRGGGTDSFMQTQNGNANMVSAESYEWTAYIAVDYLLRVLNGEDNPTVQNIPFMMISYENVKKLENKKKEDSDIQFIEEAFDKKFKNKFLKSWNIKLNNSENSEQGE